MQGICQLTNRISPFDHTHHFTVGGTYNLPFGRGKMFDFGGSRLMDEIFGGYVLNGIYQFQTGAPIFFQYDLALAPGVTPSPITSKTRQPSLDQSTSALNVNQFVISGNPSTCNANCGGSVNLGGQLASNYHYRTFPQTLSWVRQDGYNNLDASILKNFHITEGKYFQLRLESLNTLNHAIFAASNVGSSSGESSTSFGVINAVTSNSQPRQFQIGGRLVF